MKDSKKEKILFGHFRLRFFIIIGFIFLAVILIYLYSSGVFRDWQIQLSYYNGTVAGDGLSTVSIPFTILKGTEQPITVPIQVQAITNIGSVQTNCTAPSVCSVIFTAPFTSKLEYANISINVGGTSGGVTKIIQIKVLPDPTSSIMLNIGITNIPAPYPTLYLSYGNTLYFLSRQYSPYGYTQYSPYTLVQVSSINVTAVAIDGNRVLVPDGTVIRFSAGKGSLANSSCITNNGSCSVAYIPPSQLGNITISAVSYNATASEIVSIVRPPMLSNFTYDIQNDTLTMVAHSQAYGLEYCAAYNYSLTGTATFAITVRDVLNEPLSGVTVSGQSAYGTVFGCTTNNQGECDMRYNVNASYIYDNSTSAFFAAEGGQVLYTPSLTFSMSLNNSSYSSLTFDCNSGLACNYVGPAC